ncbi:MAG: lipid A biosynthesis acyltransferase, partial [Nevskiales bacterium]
MSQGWKQQRERSNPRTLRLIRWIALHMGRGFSRLLLYPIVAYFLCT